MISNKYKFNRAKQKTYPKAGYFEKGAIFLKLYVLYFPVSLCLMFFHRVQYYYPLNHFTLIDQSKIMSLHNIGEPDRYPISVFVPVYNKMKYLPTCLHCCLNQTYPHHEILFVDDCSKDNSFNFLEKETKNDKRVSIVRHLYNKGTFHSRRTGVLYAQGKYILSYDPDDFLPPTVIQDLLEFISNGPKRQGKNNEKSNRNDYMKFDVLEFRLEAKFGKKFRNNFQKCERDFTNDTYGLYTSFSQHKLGNNVLKRLIKREIYLKAFQILFPFIKNKKICVAEDQIIISIIFALTNRYVCTQILGYYYFFHKKDNSLSGKYQEKTQINIQHRFGVNFVHFGKSRIKNYVDVVNTEKTTPNINLDQNYRDRESLWEYVTNQKKETVFYDLDKEIKIEQEQMKDLWDKIDDLKDRKHQISCNGSDHVWDYILDKEEDNCIIRHKL